MDTRRLFLAIVLSLTVVIGWQVLFPSKPRDLPATAPAAGQAAAPAVEATASQPARPPLPAAPNPLPVPSAAAAEERVVLANEEFEAVFSNRGAQLVSLKLKRQKTAKGELMELVRAREASPYPFGLVTPAIASHPLNGVLFQVEKTAGEVRFTYRLPGLSAEKVFRLGGNGFLDGEVRVYEGEAWGLFFGPGVRNLTAEELDSQFEMRGAAYRTAGGEVEVVDGKKAEEALELRRSGARWVALEDTHFIATAIPGEGVARVSILPLIQQDKPLAFLPLPPEEGRTKEEDKAVRELAAVVWPEGASTSFRTYWGSKEYDRLKALGLGLEDTVQLGMFGVLALPLLRGLHFLYDNVVANYGWAIVLMTLFIRILLLPLTHYSTISMRKMQLLAPKQQAIRERYKNKLRDKQGKPNMEVQRKMNEEVMALYREEKVNPASGCLPILLQMPVLFAFYAMLSTAVELRNAPWALWITDLAARDPYYVLPIVMGLTQFLQVRLSPQAGDPMQRRLFQAMPLVMTVLFLGFPSGLVLYWLTNNVLSIVQQWIYNRKWKKQEANA